MAKASNSAIGAVNKVKTSVTADMNILVNLYPINSKEKANINLDNHHMFILANGNKANLYVRYYIIVSIP